MDDADGAGGAPLIKPFGLERFRDDRAVSERLGRNSLVSSSEQCRNPDVLVIGGGAIGAACAYEIARLGARVTLVERGADLAAGCSAGSAGLICPSHSQPLATPSALKQGVRWMLARDSPFYLRPRLGVVPWLARFVAACTPTRAEAGMRLIRALSLESLGLHAPLVDSGIETGYTRRGILNVYETARGLVAGLREAEMHTTVGMRSKTLSPDHAREAEPSLTGAFAGAILYRDEAHCDPERFVLSLGEAAAAAGAEIRRGVEVIGLRREGDRVTTVETTVGPLYPGTVVLAAGAWTVALARQVGVHLLLEGGKGYHVEFESVDADPGMPVFLQEARVIATPLPGRLRLSGTLELAGLDLAVSRRRIAINQAGERILSLENRRVVHVWRGLRPCAPHGLPLLGQPAGLENVIVATGHAMMGLTLAPITGRLVAGLAARETPQMDIAPLHPDRFRRFWPFVAGSRTA